MENILIIKRQFSIDAYVFYNVYLLCEKNNFVEYKWIKMRTEMKICQRYNNPNKE